MAVQRITPIADFASTRWLRTLGHSLTALSPACDCGEFQRYGSCCESGGTGGTLAMWGTRYATWFLPFRSIQCVRCIHYDIYHLLHVERSKGFSTFSWIFWISPWLLEKKTNILWALQKRADMLQLHRPYHYCQAAPGMNIVARVSGSLESTHLSCWGSVRESLCEIWVDHDGWISWILLIHDWSPISSILNFDHQI